MKYDLHAIARSRAICRVGQVPFNELHRLKPCKITALTCNEAVDSTHLLPTLQQRRRNRSPYEACGPCNKILCHSYPFRICIGLPMLFDPARPGVLRGRPPLIITCMTPIDGISLSDLKRKIENRQARIGIVGMGYVGLPLALL